MPKPNDPLPRPVGYTALLQRFDLTAPPNWHTSFVSDGRKHQIHVQEDKTEEVFPSTFWPGESLGSHLEFALKYDGVHLQTLSQIFQAAPSGEILTYLHSKPTGKYARRIWYLFELLTGTTLPVPDLTQGNYVDLLDREQYYTLKTPERSRRHRINDNQLGNRDFCPTIRRTPALQAFEKAQWNEACLKIAQSHTPSTLKRALGYLYRKETKSSFAIENLKPNADRTERFVAQLQLATKQDFCERERLIDLQNQIVDPRFQDSGYRTSQNYVGETLSWDRERVHFISPKPGDLPALMEGLLACHDRMTAQVSPVAHAAAIAYGFVFLHPFEDGNGRIHRFLIHNILALEGFTPAGIMFPISACMASSPELYDSSLEAFSTPLMQRMIRDADYTLNQDGSMTVLADTADWYRYPDMTAQAEALFQFIQQTVEVEWVKELAFLTAYDQAKQQIQAIADIPDRSIDLLIRFCRQNQGRVSPQKRTKFFEQLTQEELSEMEQAVRTSFSSQDS